MFGLDKKMTADERRSYEIEADFGIMSASELCTIGEAYDNGSDGRPQDHERAMLYYLRAAEMGNEVAQYNAGFNYFYGEGTEQDIVEAEHWLLEAAKQQFDESYHLLGMIYQNDYPEEDEEEEEDDDEEEEEEEEEEEDEPNYDLAIYWHERAAIVEDGDPVASQRALFEIYSDEESDYFDGEKAMYWLNTLARNGNEEAIERFGSEGEDYPCETYLKVADKYSKGKKKDFEKETYWYHKAALTGDLSSMCFYANRLLSDENVDEIDEMYAFYWHKTAADAGYQQSQMELAHLYLKGTGVKKDIEKAYYWIGRAVDNTNTTGDEAFDKQVLDAAFESFEYIQRIYISEVDFDTATTNQLRTVAEFWINGGDSSKALEYAEIGAIRGCMECAYHAGWCYCQTIPPMGSRKARLASWWMTFASNSGLEQATRTMKQIPLLIARENLMSHQLMAQMVDEYGRQGDLIRQYYYASILSQYEGYESFAFLAGKRHFHGYGTFKNGKNYKKALSLFIKSSAIMHCLSALYIAEIYLTGGNGVERDLNEAVKWYQKAISADSKKVTSDEYTNLAHACLKLGEESDALNYYKKAEKLKR